MPTLYQFSLSDLNKTYSDFSSEFLGLLGSKPNYLDYITTETSNELVNLVAATATFQQNRIKYKFGESFTETAQNTSGIQSISQMMGLRLSRKLPAAIRVTLTVSDAITIPPYTQFSGGGGYMFNRTSLQLLPGNNAQIELYLGRVMRYRINGIGSDFQLFASPEADFRVSDIDTTVLIDGVPVTRVLGGLWNRKNKDGWVDSTLSDGKLLIQFGTENYGTVPRINEVVDLTYVLTTGAEDNGNRNFLDRRINSSDFPSLEGRVVSLPTGGANEKAPGTYVTLANNAGVYNAAVNKRQYQSLVMSYPGIIDAVTQSQREIDPSDLMWMNFIRVVYLSNSPWTVAQEKKYLEYLQENSMGVAKFKLELPYQVNNDVLLNVYCVESARLQDVKSKVEAAMRNLFAIRAGILGMDLFKSDLVTASLNAAPGEIAYLDVAQPVSDVMKAGKLSMPELRPLDEQPGLGSLTQNTYAYCVTVYDPNLDEESPAANWQFLTTVSSDAQIRVIWSNPEYIPSSTPDPIFRIYGRVAGDTAGLLHEATYPKSTTTYEFFDSGAITPDINKPPKPYRYSPVKYNVLRGLTVNVYYAEQRGKGTYV